MTTYSKPAYLQSFKPQEQALFSVEHFAFSEMLLSFGLLGRKEVVLITDYTLAPMLKFDTEKMTQFFLKKIPKASRTLYIDHHKEFSSCLLDAPVCLKPSIKGAVVLSNSPERKLFALLACFFNSKDTDLIRNNPNDAKAIASDQSEFNFAIGLVPHVQIIKNCETNSDDKCHKFVFGNMPWFTQANEKNSFWGALPKVLKFFKSKGYEVSKKPAQNHVAMYFDSKGPSHYAIVVEVEKVRTIIKKALVEKDGAVWVDSKFGKGAINRHLVELAPFYFAQQVLYLQEIR